MQPDFSAYFLAVAAFIAIVAGTMTAKSAPRLLTLPLWATSLLIFALVGFWVKQDLANAAAAPPDRIIALSVAISGLSVSALFVLTLWIKGSPWSARIFRTALQKTIGRLPWRLRLERIHKSGEAAGVSSANPESFERLRELWRVFDAAMDFARNRLADQLTPLRYHGGVARVVVQLEAIEQRRFREAAEQLRLAIAAGGTTDTDLRRLTEQFSEVADQYARRASDWLEIATNTFGEGYYSSDPYRRFFELHRNACEELHRLQGRGDFGHLLRRHPFFQENALRAPGVTSEN